MFTRQRGADDSPVYDYRQVGRLKFSQSYDIIEARDDLADGIPDNKRRPFSPIKADLDLFLGRYLTIDADADWDVYDDKFTTTNAAVIVTDKRGDRFYTDYRFAEDESESIYFNINLRVSNSFATFFEYERNILDDRRIDTIVGIAYESQCWSTEFRYIDEPQNRTFQFSINLKGLGEFGF